MRFFHSVPLALALAVILAGCNGGGNMPSSLEQNESPLQATIAKAPQTAVAAQGFNEALAIASKQMSRNQKVPNVF